MCALLIQCIDIKENREYNNIKKEVINMANTNVTMRIDETLKSQLQELMSSLGLDMTTLWLQNKQLESKLCHLNRI